MCLGGKEGKIWWDQDFKVTHFLHHTHPPFISHLTHEFLPHYLHTFSSYTSPSFNTCTHHHTDPPSSNSLSYHTNLSHTTILHTLHSYPSNYTLILNTHTPHPTYALNPTHLLLIAHKYPSVHPHHPSLHTSTLPFHTFIYALSLIYVPAIPIYIHSSVHTHTFTFSAHPLYYTQVPSIPFTFVNECSFSLLFCKLYLMYIIRPSGSCFL